MEWHKLSPNRWHCKYKINIKFCTWIICNIYRRGKKKRCTWEIKTYTTGYKIYKGKTQTVSKAKDEIKHRILEMKMIG